MIHSKYLRMVGLEELSRLESREDLLNLADSYEFSDEEIIWLVNNRINPNYLSAVQRMSYEKYLYLMESYRLIHHRPFGHYGERDFLERQGRVKVGREKW